MECPTVCLIWMNVPNKLVYNEQGLLLCWNFITSSPELKPNRITDDEDKS